MAQLTVSLLTEQDLGEGVMKMVEFEIKIDKKVFHMFSDTDETHIKFGNYYFPITGPATTVGYRQTQCWLQKRRYCPRSFRGYR